MKIIVAGDAMRDIYHLGTITRLNPENPAVPLVRVLQTEEFPGGAGNVAENLRELGVETRTVFGGRTIEKHRVIHTQTYNVLFRFDVGDFLEPAIRIPHIECDGLIISDYQKGSIDSKTITFLARESYKTFIDTKGPPTLFEGIPWPVCFFPNGDEYEKYKREYDQIIGQGKSAVLVTKGCWGAKLYFAGKEVLFPAQTNAPKNPCGAGDTVVAAFTFAYLTFIRREIPLVALMGAAKFSMYAAAIAVEHPLTHAPRWSEIYDRFGVSVPEMEKVLSA